MKSRLLINGAHGRMGQLAFAVIHPLPDFEIVAQCDHKDDLAKEIMNHQVQVVFDVTSAESVYRNTETILTCGARPIIGTSGLNEKQVNTLRKIAKEKKLGGIIAPNFSIGAILMMRFAKEAAKFFPKAAIIEMHHEHKKDAPSGTAIRTAEMMETHPAIHSVRLPGILSRQQIILGSIGETLTIDHNTLSREAFAAGIRLACEKIMQVNELVYGLEVFLVNPVVTSD